jgi:hypothetical protein
MEDRVEAIRIESEEIDEDEASDLGNDSMFLESLRSHLAIKVQSPQEEDPVTLSSMPSKLSERELIEIVLELSIDRRLALVNTITQSIGQELLNKVA